MKKLTFLICFLLSGQVWAYGTAKEDTSTAITFVHSIGMDSVRYYAGQDTSSWEIDRLMSRGFSPDSTNYVLVDTFDNPGTYFVKIEYWEGGAASAKYLPDIRHVAPANADVNVASMDGGVIGVGDFATGAITGDAWAASATDEIWEADTSTFSAAQGVGEMLKDTTAYQGAAAGLDSGAVYGAVVQFHEDSLADANVIQISGDATAADNAELFFDDTGFNASNSKIGTVTEVSSFADSAANKGSFKWDYFDFLKATVWRDTIKGTYLDLPNEAQFVLRNIEDFLDGSGSGVQDIDSSAFNDSYWTAVYNAGVQEGIEISIIKRAVAPHVGTVNDAAPTASQFVVSAGIGAYGDDYFNTLFLTFITGNLLGRSERVTDFETTNDTIFVTSFFAAPANGDSFSIGPGNFDIISDSAVYQGAGGGGSIGDSTIARIDSIFASTGDSLGVHVGKAGLSTTTVSLHMKQGGYSGAAGSPNNIKDHITAISTGAGVGSQPETIYVYDTSNSVTVPNIPIQARNSSGTNLGQVTTNSEGYGVLNQDDAATIYVRISGSSGYVAANNPETISVASPYRDTVYVVAFSPSAPAGDLCGVYGWVKDQSDNPIEGAEITATIDSYYWPIKYQNQAIVAHASATSDTTGYWYLPIFPSSLLLTAYGDSSSSYGMSCSYQGQSIFRHQKVTVPDSTTWLMIPDDD